MIMTTQASVIVVSGQVEGGAGCGSPGSTEFRACSGTETREVGARGIIGVGAG